MANDDRRVNMYFSEKKYIDDTIYQHFKDMPNKQDIIKMVLYEYVKSKNVELDNFVTKNTQNVHSNNTKITQKSVVTKTTPKKHKNVTKKTQENNEDVTKNTPNSEAVVNKDTQISDFKTKQEEMRKKALVGLSCFNK